MNFTFKHETDRIVMFNEAGEEAGEITFLNAGDHFTIIHTGVNPEYRGQDLGRRLVLQAVEKAYQEKLKIIPSCPFARKFFVNNPEYQDVLYGKL